MKKWIIPVLILFAGAGLAWQQGWFPAVQTLGEGQFADHVPAQTPFYMGGRLDRAQAEAFREMPLVSLSPYQLERALTAFDFAAEGEETTPGGRFARALMRDALTHGATYGEFYDHLGIDLTGSHAVYLDDLFPVVRLAIADPEAFRNFLHGASEESGITPRPETIGGEEVHLWPLTEDGEPWYLAARLADGIATLTLLRESEEAAARRRRLALEPPAQSLAASGELQSLRETHGFSDDMLAFVHLERLARRLLQPGENDHALADVPTSCRQDAVALAGRAPRWVLGSIATPDSPPDVTTARAVLELEHTGVITSLEKLRGHIPGHTLADDDPVMALGLGLNIDALVPAATRLWSLFVESEFQCPSLVKAQQRVANTPPAMLGAATGMFQGVQGAGLSLYHFTAGDSADATALDFLVSIAAESPRTLISVLNNNPLGLQVGIPTDGSTRALDLSAVAPGLQVEAGIKGQHLVFYTGERGTAAARRLEDEPLEANGLGSLAVDYTRLADLIEATPAAPAARMANQPEINPCLDQARLVSALRAQPFGLRYHGDVTPRGLVTDMTVTLQTTGRASLDPVGEFAVLDRTEDCQRGDPAGTLVLEAGGSGRYEQGNADCTLDQRRYDWTRQGDSLHLRVHESRHRPRCDAAWEDRDTERAECVMSRVEGGLQCLYREGKRERLWLLQRQ